MSSKKGQFEPARKTIFWTIAVFMITAIILVFGMVMATYKGKLTHVPETLESELILQRFINSPDCFAYQDPTTGRVYPGVIDMRKFNNQTLYSCYHTGQKEGHRNEYNFGLKLLQENQFLRTNNYHYEETFVVTKPVLIWKEGLNWFEWKFATDTLEIRVQPGFP